MAEQEATPGNKAAAAGILSSMAAAYEGLVKAGTTVAASSVEALGPVISRAFPGVGSLVYAIGDTINSEGSSGDFAKCLSGIIMSVGIAFGA